MIRIRKIAAFAVLLLFPFLLLASPKDYATACAEGIALWSKSVLPALFPFMVTASLLSKTGAAKISDRLSPLMRSCKLPAAASLCIFLSVLSGYPVGSRCLLDMKNAGLISENDTTRASFVCSTSGPMFLLGSVGANMFSDLKAGFILLAAHLCGVFLVYAFSVPFLKPSKTSDNLPVSLQKSDNVFAESIQNSVISILCVGGFIAYFCVIAKVLENTKLMEIPVFIFSSLFSVFRQSPAANGFVYGLLECTRGCAELAAYGGFLALPCAAFCVTLGGASILAQQIAFLKPAGVKIKRFVAIKFIQAFLAFFLCLLFQVIFL